ncbi:hypothetical protein BDZ97DRAFT_1756828 [Flammula alnicola]|nr:hypothetical protein BDZ97DRAFT_1756828 [Flammula alnicola]
MRTFTWPNLSKSGLVLGQLPLYIRLHANSELTEPSVDEPYIELLISAVVACSSRWIHLDMRLPKRILMRVRCSSQTPLMLKILKLRLFTHDIEDPDLLPTEKISFNASTSPAELETWELGIAQIDIEWNNLTHVTAHFFSINDCFELLQKAPQMTHCTLVEIVGGPDDFPIPQAIIPHRRLSFLDIACAFEFEMINAFLAWTAFPALEIWKIRKELPIDILIAHIARSSCRLKSMMLFQDDALVDPNELNKALRATLSLEQLTLRCYREDVTYLDSLFPLPQ